MKMNEIDQELLDNFSKERNHSSNTKHQYKYALEDYVEFQKESLYNLLKEAEKEEDNGVRWKRRTLRKRLINFRTYVYDKFKVPETARKRLQFITTFYKHHEIELQPLPPRSNLQNIQQNKIITYEDLPTKEIIKDALKIANPLMKAIILFQVSSGCARRETLNLTIRDFIESLSDYTDSRNIYEIIKELKHNKEVVPTFKLTRQKTGNTYYTFCSPEAVMYILAYLEADNRVLKLDSPLFSISERVFITKYTELNDKLGLGKKGNHRRFRSHMLRKFHASNLYQGENSLSIEEIDHLQGRRKNSIHTSYFMENPNDLKKKYVQAMHKLLINFEFNEITVDSPEYNNLQVEFDSLKRKYDSVVDDERFEEVIRNLIKEELNNKAIGPGGAL